MKFIYSLLVILTFNYSYYAQDSTKSKNIVLKHGIQFQLHGLFNLGNFNGYTLAYQYLINKNGGLRIGLSNRIRNDIDESVTTVDSLKFHNPLSSNSIDLEISIQYLYRLKAYKDFKLLLGGGPLIGYQHEDSDNNSQQSYYNYSSRKINKSKGIKYGFDIILGVEYQFSENIVFSGEYDINASLTVTDYKNIEYRYYDDSSENYKKITTGDRKSFLMDRSRVNLGITLFF